LNSFVSHFLASALKTICDGGGEIFGAWCGGAGSVSARSNGAAEHFVAIAAAVIGDCGAFGLGLLWLGFGSPTLVASSAFAAW
jgi:hypothetical protein